MKKTHLKTFLFIEGNTVANETVLYAAQMNAGSKSPELGINGLFIFAHSFKDVGRFEDTQVERVGENKLHIDAKINGKWENVLIVEEVEVFSLPIPTEEETEQSNSFY